MEQVGRREVERSLAELIEAQGSGATGSATELGSAASAYIRAEQERTEASSRFAAGDITLSELQSLIVARGDALDHLRLAALNCGAEL
jgi:hypothetical protein